GSVKLWGLSRGETSARLLVSLVSLKEAGWMALTPDGLFDGTPAAWGAALWRLEGKTLNHVPVEAFFNAFVHPAVLIKILAGKGARAPAALASKDVRQPTVIVAIADALSTHVPVESPIITVHVCITEALADPPRYTAGSGAKDARLFRNGSLVRVW